ncbi:hypothetical protein CTA2_12088 [Colletotrichum tanaceti]|uniref:Rhodopsin domain-containing protein n=1 Tax=Colletotrichum tanaceti TaxID=1306861 RepID=A0A4U6XNW4_9PEZI|nr:hypothetical protein CTA2_12088 [Colletotrichum tanaceti]TKW57460.1 hypothetical protein CTA1_8512 [Colletotrichum tanaceti]
MDFEYETGPGLEVVSAVGANANDTKTNLVTVIWGVNLTAFILVGLLVPLRVIVRCTITRNFFSDDVLVIIAALFTFGICSLLPIATDLGLGQHSRDIDAELLPENTKSLLQLIFIANILYPCAVAFARLSAVCSFLRLITGKTARWLLFAAAALTSVFALSCVLAVVFQCRPISAAWDSSTSISGDASCFPLLDFLRVSTAIGIGIDALLCTAPLAYFWRMEVPLRKKVQVTVLLAFAGLSCVAAVIKIVNLRLLNQGDITYNWTSWVLFSIAECTVGIIAMSIPPILPLFTKCSRRRKYGVARPRKGGGDPLRFTSIPGRPVFNRAIVPRVIKPMATPWKDRPLEKTTNPDFKPDFRWLRLENAEASNPCWDRTPYTSKAGQVLGIAL